MRFKIIYFFLIVFIFSQCKSPEKIKIIPANEHVAMADYISGLLADGSDKIKITLSEKSGTSVYMIAYMCDDEECAKSDRHKLLGAILPENSSTRVLGEIFSYNLARVLGVEDIYGPGAHIVLRGEGLKKFRSMILDAKYAGLKEDNRKKLIKMTSASDELYCAYKKWEYRPCDLDKLENDGQINTENILAKYIKANNDKPGPEKIQLSDLSSQDLRGQAKAIDLAKQLSAIMIIDILTAQWDRWSGGNIQAIVVKGKMNIVAFDNGGTFKYNDQLLNSYLSIVTRFDKKIADVLIEMDMFLNEKTVKSFFNCSTENELRYFLGVIKGPDNLSNANRIWGKFKIRLMRIVEHIKNIKNRYGAERCYF